MLRLSPAAFFFGFALMLSGLGVGRAAESAETFPVSEDYVLRTWEMDDGMPNNNVFGIAQTPDGYLWLATGSGVARFDGERFTTFLRDTTPGLEANRVRTVFAARDGALWIGLERGGVSRRMGDRFEAIVPLSPAQATVVWTSSFAQGADGGIWFGSNPDQKVSRWKDGAISTFSSKEGVGPGFETFVHADTSGRIWFSTTQSCGVFDGKRFQPMGPTTQQWTRLTPSRDGGMWATRGGQLMRYHLDGSSEVVASLGDMLVSTLYEDHAGNLWIGTDNLGLFRFREGAFVRVPTSHTVVSTIMEDREENLWVGTVGGGLDRLRPCRFFLHQKKHGLRTDYVVSLCKDSEGKLWLANWGSPPVRALDSNNHSFATPAGWSSGSIMALCPDPSGGVWLGTLFGLMHWKDGVFATDTLPDAITALLVDHQGDLWVATIKGGLIRWRNGNAVHFPQQNGLVETRALAEDTAGRLWVGTEKGLLFMRQNSPKGDTLSPEAPFVPEPLPGAKPYEQIRFIVPDEKDTVWIGSVNGGLYRWRSGQVVRLPHDVGLPVDDLRVLAMEPGGIFWIGTGHGMFRVARSELDAVLDGRQGSVHTTIYGRNDGMPNVDFIFGFKNTTTRTRDGHLWFATTRGALEINPQIAPPEKDKNQGMTGRPAAEGDFPQSVAPLPVLIEEVQVASMPIPFHDTGKLVLPPNPGAVQIRYTLPTLSVPEQVNFRYRLTGWGDEWILAERQRTAAFAHLPPGDYRFEVAAAIADGPWLPVTASLAFTVRAAWWETIWFSMGAGLIGAGAVGALVRFIVKRRLNARIRRLEQEHALERERIRIARDMHDQLGATLTQIGLFAGLAQADSMDDSLVAGHTARVVASAHQAVSSLDEIVWAVNPHNDTLNHLLEYIGQYAADYLHTAGLLCRLDLPANPPQRPIAGDFRHNLFLIVQEALNNVVKHAGAREIRLLVVVDEKALTLEIADDGCGLSGNVNRVEANGLSNMAGRAAALGGTFAIDSPPGKGTCLKLRVPW